MAIVPDTKDWTWVLDRQCPECGLDTRTIAPGDVAARLRADAELWADALTVAGVATRTRPDAWSTLEYGCHVRDVYRLYDRRLELMLSTDDPTFPNWDQDETAVTARYGEQDPSVVSRDLLEAASALADRFDTVTGDQWERTGTRTDGARFTVATFARYLVHDPAHHLYDVSGRPATGHGNGVPGPP